MSDLSRVATERVVLLGGYAGSEPNNPEGAAVGLYNWVKERMLTAHNIANEDIIHIDTQNSIPDFYQRVSYSPEGGDGYLVEVEAEKIGLGETKKLLHTVRGGFDSDITVAVLVTVPYSRGMRGFPLYKRILEDNEGIPAIWGTYLRRDNVRTLLDDAEHRYTRLLRSQKATGVITPVQYDLDMKLLEDTWKATSDYIAGNYNRDVNEVLKAAEHIAEVGPGYFYTSAPKTDNALRTAVTKKLGAPSASLEEWILSVVQAKPGSGNKRRELNIDMAQRLYGSMQQSLYPAVMSTLNGLIEVKLHMLSGDGANGVFQGDFVNENAERYTKYYRRLKDQQTRYGVKQGIKLDQLMNARNLLMSRNRWKSALDAYMWVYEVMSANRLKES